MSDKQRWRITLDQLCYAAKIDTKTFDKWADSGILGLRLQERPDHGRGRHITRETAQKTVLIARLVQAGVTPYVAGQVIGNHRVGDDAPLLAPLASGVVIEVTRTDLP